jgi:hypothetical protein
MSKLEKAVLASRQENREWGLSPAASEAARIFHTGIVRVHDRALRSQVYGTLERSVDKKVLENVRAKAIKALRS